MCPDDKLGTVYTRISPQLTVYSNMLAQAIYKSIMTAGDSGGGGVVYSPAAISQSSLCCHAVGETQLL